MEHNASIGIVAEVIQLAVAPVFLITGIAGLLSVLTTRLHRITDRARLVDASLADAPSEEHRERRLAEANLLWRRIRSINWAIRLAVGSALLVCLVVMLLFLGDFAAYNFGGVIAILFFAAMAVLISSLLLLLIEMSISTRRMRQGLEDIIAPSQRDLK